MVIFNHGVAAEDKGQEVRGPNLDKKFREEASMEEENERERGGRGN